MTSPRSKQVCPLGARVNENDLNIFQVIGSELNIFLHLLTTSLTLISLKHNMVYRVTISKMYAFDFHGNISAGWRLFQKSVGSLSA